MTWALVGYSLAFDGDAPDHRRPGLRAAQQRRLRAARRDDDPAPRVLRLPGDVLHHHDGARVGRRRRADALRRRSSSSRRCGRCSSTPCSRTGRSAAAGWRRRGRWTSPAACRSRWARASRRSRPRSSSARARTTAARRCCRTTPSTCLLGAGLLWFGWFGFNGGSGFNTGNNSVLAFTNTLLTPGMHARGVGHPRRDPRTPGDGDRRRDGDHRRLRRDHARGRLHQPGLGDGARRARRDPELRRRSSGGRGRASTRRSTSSPRTASPASPASSSSASSRR